MGEEEFTEAAPWQAQTAGDNKTNTKLFRHRTIDDLSNYTLELEDRVGKIPENAVYLPGEEATDDEKTAFYKAYGVPEAVDGYKKIDTGLEPGVDFTEEDLSSLATMALKEKFRPGQHEAVQKWLVESVKEKLTKRNEEVKVQKAKLTEGYKEKWGENYKPNFDAMNKAVAFFDGEDGNGEFKRFLNESGAGNFPKVVEFLVEKGLSLNDDSLLEGDRGGRAQERPTQIHYKSMDNL
jgi:hypothetical protein